MKYVFNNANTRLCLFDSNWDCGGERSRVEISLEVTSILKIDFLNFFLKKHIGFTKDLQ